MALHPLDDAPCEGDHLYLDHPAKQRSPAGSERAARTGPIIGPRLRRVKRNPGRISANPKIWSRCVTGLRNLDEPTPEKAGSRGRFVLFIWPEDCFGFSIVLRFGDCFRCSVAAPAVGQKEVAPTYGQPRAGGWIPSGESFFREASDWPLGEPAASFPGEAAFLRYRYSDVTAWHGASGKWQSSLVRCKITKTLPRVLAKRKALRVPCVLPREPAVGADPV